MIRKDEKHSKENIFEFFNKRLYFEPAYALKYWPVNTNFPESFAEIESGGSTYKFEPSINFGFKF
jgi:hypothetical protein